MNRKYTAVHWLGAEILVEPFEAPNDRAAWDAMEEMGWSAYDDRTLLHGHRSESEVRAVIWLKDWAVWGGDSGKAS